MHESEDAIVELNADSREPMAMLCVICGVNGRDVIAVMDSTYLSPLNSSRLHQWTGSLNQPGRTMIYSVVPLFIYILCLKKRPLLFIFQIPRRKMNRCEFSEAFFLPYSVNIRFCF